jgi:hypothetical protein
METFSSGWIGVDLDGTLAFYDGWRGHKHVGAPIPLMVKMVKEWRKQGIRVKIFTARVSMDEGKELQETIQAIESWSKIYIGEVLEITCKKDFSMIRLYDDRAIQVITNTGQPVLQ